VEVSGLSLLLVGLGYVWLKGALLHILLLLELLLLLHLLVSLVQKLFFPFKVLVLVNVPEFVKGPLLGGRQLATFSFLGLKQPAVLGLESVVGASAGGTDL